MAIRGKVNSTYMPMLPGYAISVTMTGTKSGFTTVKTSAATAPMT